MKKRSGSLAVTGTGFRAGTFVQLYCIHDQAITPHSAGRVVDQAGGMIEIAVRCRKCGTQAIYATDQLPEGYQIYHIRITGEDGPHLPDELRPVPFVEEEFDVPGTSLQNAHERADFAHQLKLSGHLTRIYINGELHLDERF
ncbi:hypothetical protein [Hymenobacter metallilatus]|uniref:Uncharacterized protein n=1 Tax=Hymenobacter metallilatus TaxID=2493666 RepID=A0A3R9N474_9BACT|nr:hypothetical protein [Hymenobacter metallilatus]RSK24920.1 hypothetical protein EI290_17995 [Hymenobacter metallilatus]